MTDPCPGAATLRRDRSNIAGGHVQSGTRTVEVSSVVPIDAAQDMAALSQVMGDTLERLRHAIDGRTLVRAAGARMRVVCDVGGAPRSVPWRYGLPLPDGAAMLVCVADAVIRT